MLLQISTALSILEGSSINFKTRFAALLFSSAKERMRILFTVVNAVSAEEKYADNMSKIIIIKQIMNGTRNPSLSIVKKLAQGLGMQLKLEFVPMPTKNKM